MLLSKCSKSTVVLADVLGHVASRSMLKKEWNVQGVARACLVACLNEQRDLVCTRTC